MLLSFCLVEIVLPSLIVRIWKGLVFLVFVFFFAAGTVEMERWLVVFDDRADGIDKSLLQDGSQVRLSVERPSTEHFKRIPASLDVVLAYEPVRAFRKAVGDGYWAIPVIENLCEEIMYRGRQVSKFVVKLVLWNRFFPCLEGFDGTLLGRHIVFCFVYGKEVLF